MAHAQLKLLPGLDTNETPALNQSGFSATNLVRFFFDRNGLGLVQKLGGWTKFFPNTMSAIVRALWAWEDTEANAHLAVGTTAISGTDGSQLSVITNGSQAIITPTQAHDNVVPFASSTAGSSSIVITDTTIQGITQFDSVYIPFHISIGGVVLFGLYACDFDGYLSATSYTVQALDVLGNPLAATSTSSAAVLALFTTVSGSTTVTITLPNHGYVQGSLFPILETQTIGGIVFFGHYPVQRVIDANNFTIIGTNVATSSGSTYINNNLAQFVYGFGVGSIPTGTGYGIGTYGSGGYGTGTATTAAVGNPIYATDWTLDNWGEILISCAISPPYALTTTSASGNGTTGTLGFTPTSHQIAVGDTIFVSGVTPTTWNGTHTVTTFTSSTVSFATTATGPMTVAGTIALNNARFQPVYAWDAEANAPTATIIPAAPPVNDGVFVAMPQRQIIAWGSTFTGIQDPLLIRWCDVNNYNTWIAQFTNQAGSYRLPKGSRIVGALQGPQQGLVWTDIGVWSMQYVGQPYVYSFNELGSGCGLIARKAAAVLNGVTYWMGPSQFYSLSGDGVQSLPCPVWDVIFQDLDTANLEKIRIGINSQFGEITWYYPVLGGNGEPSAYVKLNVFTGTPVWDTGTLGRSAWIDQSVLGPPIGADPSSLYLYQHETSPDADGQAMQSSFQTGYFTIEEGEWKTFIDQVWFDAKWGYYGQSQNATLNLTFYVTDYPGQTPRTFGPYALTQSTKFITPRFRGRLVSIGVSSNDIGSFWRIGGPRYRYSADGKF